MQVNQASNFKFEPSLSQAQARLNLIAVLKFKFERFLFLKQPKRAKIFENR